MNNRRRRFETLVNTFGKDIYRYAFWLCRDHSLAEDLAQEAFARAWKSLDQLNDDHAAKSWLLTIVRRENARRFERLQPEIQPLETDIAAEKTHYDTRIEAFVLRQALMQLPQRYREPLVLQIVGGYSIEEIAQQLNLSPGAVMTRVHRARQKLRQALQGTEEQ
ncbi:MAG: sigma-70 family RNA polymerase sigma factor [Pseudomonadota bacterium]|nr:sigma-70 family RNA polymerase sigma factor [Pseudomonadota bacterium]